jgi:tRNA(fMet)-specific endonuclease VapC
VLGELRAGFAVGSKRAENEKVLNIFLTKPQIEVLFADQGTIAHYAMIFQELRAKGKMIPDNDLWIASLVIQHGLSLRSGDAHFDHLPQIHRA